MIIPIKCFSCGMVIADKYRFYVTEVRKRKSGKSDFQTVIYFTSEFREKTIEGQLMDEIGITRMCCRRHFLTHVDIE